MINKNIKRMLLFTTLCILLVGIVSATDVESDDSTDTIMTVSEQTTVPVETVTNVEENVINDNEKVIKKNNEKPVKTATNKIKTHIELYGTPNMYVEESDFIMGYFSDEDYNPITYADLKLSVDGDSYYTQTDEYGEFLGEYYADKPGTKTLTVSFAGNSEYAPTSLKTKFTVKGQYKTRIVLYNIKDVKLGDKVTISGHYYYDQSKPVKQTSMQINVNGQKVYAKTSNTGYFKYTYKTTKTGTNTVTVSYPGNTKIKGASVTKKFNVKSTGPHKTYISMNNIPDVNLGKTVTISGHYYYDQSKPVKQTSMQININGNKYIAKTSNTGYFKYTYKTTKTGTNTVTVSYPGNSKVKGASVTKKFNVKTNGPQQTYITMNSIPDVNLGNTVTVSGYYTYGEGQPLRQTSMLININGQKAYAKTDNNGYYKYTYKTTNTGTNTVTVSYPGNTKFKGATITKKFNVRSTEPQPTYITMNSIPDVNLGNTVTVSGYYTYGEGQPLRQTSMLININGQKAYAKTDNDGYYRYTYKTTNTGTNIVTVSYDGNTRFQGAATTKTFNVKTTGPQPTYITLNNINEVKLGEYTTISGYYTYGEGQPLKQTSMLININGQKAYARTDNNGYFTYSYKTNKAGTNTVTVSYSGTDKFYGDSISSSFNVKETKHSYDDEYHYSAQYGTYIKEWKDDDGYHMISLNGEYEVHYNEKTGEYREKTPYDGWTSNY